jgi:hypothetical protein
MDQNEVFLKSLIIGLITFLFLLPPFLNYVRQKTNSDVWTAIVGGGITFIIGCIVLS